MNPHLHKTLQWPIIFLTPVCMQVCEGVQKVLCSDLCSPKIFFMLACLVCNLGFNSVFCSFLESDKVIAIVYKAE